MYLGHCSTIFPVGMMSFSLAMVISMNYEMLLVMSTTYEEWSIFFFRLVVCFDH